MLRLHNPIRNLLLFTKYHIKNKSKYSKARFSKKNVNCAVIFKTDFILVGLKNNQWIYGVFR